MLLIGGMFGASWRDAVFGRDDCAVVVFAIFLIMMDIFRQQPDHARARSSVRAAGVDLRLARHAAACRGARGGGAPPRHAT